MKDGDERWNLWSIVLVYWQAVRGNNGRGGRPVLLAARPDGLELEYGWIKPGRFLDRTGKAAIQTVETFFEKPD